MSLVLPYWCEVLIVTLGKVNHHVLRTFREFSHRPSWRPGVPTKGGHHRLWWQDSAVLDVTTIANGAPASDHAILADIDIRVDHGGVDHTALADVHVVANLEGKEGNTWNIFRWFLAKD